MNMAAKHFDPQLGIDFHMYMLGILPIPIPIPTPHIGIVLDPFDYIPVIGGTTEINGVKRATAASMGLDIHIPIGVPHPAFFPKGPVGFHWDDEIFMGSKTVSADGLPFSRMALPVLNCQFFGMIAPPRPDKPKVKKISLVLPTGLNLAIPNNVIVGGPPTVSLLALAMRMLGPALKLLKRGAAAFKRFRVNRFANMKPGFLKCKVLRAEPVDIRDGSVSVTHEDFAIPGRLPLTWTREYASNNLHEGACGHGWETPADIRLEIGADGVTMLLGAPDVSVFDGLPGEAGIEHAIVDPASGARLARFSAEHGDEWRVRTRDGLVYCFAAHSAGVTSIATRTFVIERVEDLCGNSWRFERREGHVVRIVESGITDESGALLRGRYIEVDSRYGRIERMQLFDPATSLHHPLVAYRYDGEGDLVAALDPLEAARTFEYVEHRMVRHTDRVGLSFHYAYDARWRVIHAWGDGGLYDYRFRYDDLLNDVEITDSLGNTSIVKFDEYRLPLCEIDPLDGVTVFEYDDFGRTTAIVDPMGLRTEFAYDERGNQTRLTQPDGATVVSQYDEDNNLVAVIDQRGHARTERTDERGLLREQVDPLGATTTYDYDVHGQLVVHVNPRGAVTRLGYDRHGQLLTLTDPLGHVTRFLQDPLGRLVRQQNALAQVTSYDYDAKGRLLSVRSPDGGQVRCEYDAEDQLVLYEDEAGMRTRLQYVGIGQIGKRIQPDGHVVEYHYDTEEQLIGLTNQRGERYQLHRDALGRIVEEVDYWGQPRVYDYDASGRLRATIDPLGQRVAYETDKLGRIVRKTLPDAQQPGWQVQESFKYDRCGNLIELRNRNRHTVRKFDPAGRLLEEVQDGFRVGYGYDEAGNRVLRDTSAGHRVACAYDLRDEVAEVGINNEAPIRIARDALGRATHEQLSDSVKRSFQYDARNLLTAQQVTRDAAPLFDTAYDYDKAGNLTRRSDSQQGMDAYRYDELGRLLQHTDPKGRVERFLNDPAGDRLKTRIHEVKLRKVAGGADEAQVQWTREGTYEGVHYVFDRAGNLVRKGSPGGPEPGDLELIWDANHRLAESRRAGQVTTYGYDPLGRRVFKRNPTDTTWFYWDGDALLGEVTQANDDPEAAQLWVGNVADMAEGRKRRDRLKALHAQTREYVYYPGTFVPLALIDPQPVKNVVHGGAPATIKPIAARLPDPQPKPVVPGRLAIALAPSLTEASRRATTDRQPSAANEVPLGTLGEMSLGGGPEKKDLVQSTAEIPVEAEPSGLGALGTLGLGASELLIPVSSADLSPVLPSSGVIEQAGGSGGGANHGDPDAEAVPAPLSIVGPAARNEKAALDAEPLAVEVGPVVYHYHVDPNGCPTRITDARGETMWSASHAAWGSIPEEQITRIANPLRLQGQYLDAETGVHYNRYRYYDPAIGQFLSLDPIGLHGGINVYEFGANALAWADAYGLTGTYIFTDGTTSYIGKGAWARMRASMTQRISGFGNATNFIHVDFSGATAIQKQFGLNANQMGFLLEDRLMILNDARASADFANSPRLNSPGRKIYEGLSDALKDQIDQIAENLNYAFHGCRG